MKPTRNLDHSTVLVVIASACLLLGVAAKANAVGVQAAVICGINDYKNFGPGEEPLYAAKDAQDIYNKCIEYGVPKSNIKLLLDKKATKKGIKSAIQSAGRRTSIPDGTSPADTGQPTYDHGTNDKLMAGDVFLFYFSGQGVYGPDSPPYDESDGIDEYICPYDSSRTSYAYDISDEELQEWLNPVINLGVRVVVILDASFSGGVIKPLDSLVGSKQEVRIKSKPGAPELRKATRGGFLKSLSGSGFTVMTSCNVGELSYEWTWFQNGVFTHLLVAALSGVADDSYLSGGVGNDSGAITDTELFYGALALNSGYFHALQTVPLFRGGTAQNPQVYGDNWWVMFRMK